MLTRNGIIAVAKHIGFCFITQRDGSILPEHSELVENFANHILTLEKEANLLTRDDILTLAKKVGFCFITQSDGTILPVHSDLIETLAKNIILLLNTSSHFVENSNNYSLN